MLWLALGRIGLAVGGNALRPGRFTDPFTAVRNPIGIPGALGLTDALAGLGFLSVVLATALAALGLPARLRRSRGVERQQLRWLALAAAITGFVLVADLGVYFAFGIDVAVLPGLPFAAFPVVAGMAILRYRLFDIDVILNRTLVYGLLTVALGAGSNTTCRYTYFYEYVLANMILIDGLGAQLRVGQELQATGRLDVASVLHFARQATQAFAFPAEALFAVIVRYRVLHGLDVRRDAPDHDALPILAHQRLLRIEILFVLALRTSAAPAVESRPSARCPDRALLS